MIYVDDGTGTVGSGRMYEQEDKLKEQGSFNRAQPTAKGGYMWPLSKRGWRDANGKFVTPEAALGRTKNNTNI